MSPASVFKPPSELDFIQVLQAKGLDSRSNGRVISFTCPECDRRRRAFLYLQRPDGSPNFRGAWRCNRREACNASGFLFPDGNRFNTQLFDKRFSKRKRRKTEKTTDQRSKVLEKSLGALPSSARRYLLEKRGFSERDLELLEQGRFVGDLSKAKGTPSAHKYVRDGYELFVPLQSLEDGRLVSGQSRYSSTRPLGKRPKVKSLPGGYGEAGAVFGNIEEVLKEARQKGQTIHVTEGLVDTLTALVCEIPTVIGVPGVGLALHLLRQLIKREWRGTLVLSLDGDGAGAASVRQLITELEDSGYEGLNLLNARPLKGDLNEAFIAGGHEAVRELLQNPRPIPRPEILPDSRMSNEAKARARKVFFDNEDKPHSGLRSSARSGACGVLVQDHRRYLLEHGYLRGLILSRSPKVCGSQGCLYCRGRRWRKQVDHLRETWPATLRSLTLKLEDNQPEALSKLRSKLSSKTRSLRKEDGGSYLTAINVPEGKLTVVVDDINPELANKIEEVLGIELKEKVLDEVLEQMRDAYLGFAAHAAELYESGQDPENDPWAPRRANSFSRTGKGLPIRKEKDLEKDLIEEVKELRAEVPIAERDSFDLYTIRKQGELIGAFISPVSSKALIYLADGRPCPVRPGEFGNLLDSYDKHGEAIQGFLEELYEREMGLPLSLRSRAPPPDRETLSGPAKEHELEQLASLHNMRQVLEKALEALP